MSFIGELSHRNQKSYPISPSLIQNKFQHAKAINRFGKLESGAKTK